jgi:3-deoxy-7-phosphoheptulonate synthase
MTTATDDLRIRDISALSTPDAVMQEVPAAPEAMQTVADARRAVQEILHGQDHRVAVVVGPCSIHDPKSAMEYANRLVALRITLGDRLELIMRVYFEKPRTTVGWKGLINDPDLDDSFQINKGLRLARRLLADINALGLPAGAEFLDTTTPQYFADLVAWAAIGARTTESQIHREMASGLSCPVGFKNGTSGDVKIAVDAVKSASNPHHFLAVTKNGECAIAETTGNEDCHIILRGGSAPNYDAASVAAACEKAENSGIAPVVMIDASHANSGKNPDNQPAVIDDIANQIKGGERRIFGVMIESHLVGGRQDQKPGQDLTYGQSITDGCLDWDRTVACLETLAEAVATRKG